MKIFGCCFTKQGRAKFIIGWVPGPDVTILSVDSPADARKPVFRVRVTIERLHRDPLRFDHQISLNKPSRCHKKDYHQPAAHSDNGNVGRYAAPGVRPGYTDW